MVDLIAWVGTATMVVGALTRLPAVVARFVRELIPLIRAYRDLRSEFRKRGGESLDRNKCEHPGQSDID